MCSQLTFDSTIFDCQGRSGICGNIACNFAIRPLLPISLYYNRSTRADYNVFSRSQAYVMTI